VRRAWLASWGPVYGLALLYAVGLASHAWAPLRPLMLVLTPWFLWGSGLAVVLVATPPGSRAAWLLWAAPVLALTFALEVLGVATGAVFGAYSYGSVLGWHVAGVPPVIGFNWVLVVWGVVCFLRRALPRGPVALRIVLTSLACVAFDLLLEPVAIRLDYWHWDAGSVPLQNYLAWGLIAAAAAWWAEFRAGPFAVPLPAFNLLWQALFFAGLQVFLR